MLKGTKVEAEVGAEVEAEVEASLEPKAEQEAKAKEGAEAEEGVKVVCVERVELGAKAGLAVGVKAGIRRVTNEVRAKSEDPSPGVPVVKRAVLLKKRGRGVLTKAATAVCAVTQSI